MIFRDYFYRMILTKAPIQIILMILIGLSLLVLLGELVMGAKYNILLAYIPHDHFKLLLACNNDIIIIINSNINL